MNAKFNKAMINLRNPFMALFRIAENQHWGLVRPMLILFLLLGSLISTFPQTTAFAASGSNKLFEMKDGSSRIGNEAALDQPCSNDPYEDDNNYTQAQPISTDGIIQAHVNTNPPSEEDWVKFNATAGDQYEIRTELTNDINQSDPAANDTLLYLYDTDGTTQLAFNDDVGWTTWYAGYAYYRESIIDFTPTTSGTYYVRELQWGPTAGNTIRDCHTYNLWVMDLTTIPITTSASAASDPMGTAVTAGDTATFVHGNNPTGSITFTLYSNASCTSSVPGMSGSGAISSNSASWSTSWTPTVSGTYYWTASYPGDAHNNAYTTTCSEGNEEIVVDLASPTITTSASPTSGIVGTAMTTGDSATLTGGYNPTGSVSFSLYSDSSCTMPVSGMSGSGTISSNSAAWSTSWTPSAAGTYYWQASYPGDANNNGFTTACGSTNEQITVAPANQTISFTSTAPSGATFGGPTYTPTATATSGLPVTITVDPTASTVCSINGSGVVSFIGVGSCVLDANQSGNANYNAAPQVQQSFIIGKATSTVTVTCPLTAQTYTGSAIKPCTAEATGAGMSPVDVTASLIYGNNINAGTATADASWSGDANHTGNSGSSTFDIAKADATILVTPYTVPYDGSAHTAIGSAKGVLGEDLSGLDLSATTHTDAGSYLTDPWTFTDVTGNYNNASGSVDDEIARADATILVTPYSLTYDGSAHTAIGSAKGVLGEDLSGLDLSATTHTDAGSYLTDPWTFTDVTGNYNNASGSVDDEIARADATILVTPYSLTYDGSAHTAIGSAKGVLGEDLSGLDLSATTHTDAGSYLTDPWTFTDATGNYNNASGSVDDEIAKADATILVTPYSLTYDAAAHTAIGTAKGVLGEDLSGLVLSATTHTDAGSYLTDPWTFTDATGNYNNASGSVDDEIKVFMVTITGFTADGTDMAVGSGGGYILPTTNVGTINHEIQFKTGSTASKPFSAAVGLYLDPTHVDVAELTAYYTENTPAGPYRDYLIAALDGSTHPFAYITTDSSNNLVLHDAAQYDIAGNHGVGMVVPDDYPTGTYPVQGTAEDGHGNTIPVALSLIVQGSRTAPTISGNAGVGGATLSYIDGSPKTATADGSGNYSFTVSYDWSGTVTPSLAGYTFSPVDRSYSNILSDQSGQDYTAIASTPTISGNAGVGGATLSYADGAPKTATADGSGNYSFTVSYNWSGTVTPSLAGYTFSPVDHTYSNILTDQSGQDYTATAITYTISGNAGVAGATLSYTDGSPKTATADGSGNYSFAVSYNWSGTVTPFKIRYDFTPPSITYSNVLADQTSQDYTAAPVATFADVPVTYWAWNWIERLYYSHITGGCGTSPLIYCPNTAVTRAQMAIFLERGINGSSYTPPPATGTVFLDVPISFWDAAWIEQLYADGITGGCIGSPLNYCPNNPVTRAQMAIFLLRAEHGSSYTPPAATGTVFGDVPISFWDAAWIEQLYAEGITGGCGSGNYCPNTAVTRAQMAVFLVRTFNLP